MLVVDDKNYHNTYHSGIKSTPNEWFHVKLLEMEKELASWWQEPSLERASSYTGFHWWRPLSRDDSSCQIPLKFSTSEITSSNFPEIATFMTKGSTWSTCCFESSYWRSSLTFYTFDIGTYNCHILWRFRFLSTTASWIICGSRTRLHWQSEYVIQTWHSFLGKLHYSLLTLCSQTQVEFKGLS